MATTANAYSLPMTQSTFKSSSVTNQIPSNTKTAFKAPAHKHAHHLHSIPPREKSTRTLIIDHMLWVHGRTRFAQARAELGMTDRTGGPSSRNYAHRQRPENFEEDEEERSDGEDVHALMPRLGAPHEEDKFRNQDLSLAKNLRLRAENLENVVTSMLDQPPTIHPMTDEDLLTLPTSPQLQPLPNRREQHLHTLPNGVRLRLALGTVINDLFSRADLLPPDHKQHKLDPYAKGYSAENFVTPTSECSTATILSGALPNALTPLASISPISPNVTQPMLPPPIKSPNISVPNIRPRPIHGHARALYAAGASHGTAGFPHIFRCPRHLCTTCQVCAEASVKSATGRRRSESLSNSRGGLGGISGWKEGSGIGSGLARPGPDGTVLRRVPSVAHRASTTTLLELIPRFLRLSALVVTELANEASGDGDYSSETSWDTSDERRESDGKSTRDREPLSPSLRAGAQLPNRVTLQPSNRWYMLLAGLLTRAVLEGYLTAGWTGPEAVERLLTVGFDIPESTGSREEKEDDDSRNIRDEFEEFDPDELPSLREAAKVLFPSPGIGQRNAGAAGDFEVEMEERLRKFYDIPSSTSSLSNHLEDLALQYPAEPMERAAVRFCEAVAKWRGKPELEMCKKRPPGAPRSKDSETSNRSAIPIEAFVHSNPTSPVGLPPASILPNPNETGLRRPSIDGYFTQVPTNIALRNKRMRSPSDLRAGSGKRLFR